VKKETQRIYFSCVGDLLLLSFMNPLKSRAALLSTSKYFDLTAFFAPLNTGTLGDINAIALGNDNTQRNGRVIQNKSLHVKLYLGANAAVPITNDQIIRVIIVYDGSPNTTPVGTDLLVVNNVLSHVNFNNSQRFIFLLDKLFIISFRNTTAGSLLASSDIYGYHEEIINIDLPTIFGNASSFQTGAIRYYVLDSNPSSQMQLSILSRLYFEDN